MAGHWPGLVDAVKWIRWFGCPAGKKKRKKKWKNIKNKCAWFSRTGHRQKYVVVAVRQTRDIYLRMPNTYLLYKRLDLSDSDMWTKKPNWFNCFPHHWEFSLVRQCYIFFSFYSCFFFLHISQINWPLTVVNGGSELHAAMKLCVIRTSAMFFLLGNFFWTMASLDDVLLEY